MRCHCERVIGTLPAPHLAEQIYSRCKRVVAELEITERVRTFLSASTTFFKVSYCALPTRKESFCMHGQLLLTRHASACTFASAFSRGGFCQMLVMRNMSQHAAHLANMPAQVCPSGTQAGPPYLASRQI